MGIIAYIRLRVGDAAFQDGLFSETDWGSGLVFKAHYPEVIPARRHIGFDAVVRGCYQTAAALE